MMALVSCSWPATSMMVNCRGRDGIGGSAMPAARATPGRPARSPDPAAAAAPAPMRNVLRSKDRELLTCHPQFGNLDNPDSTYIIPRYDDDPGFHLYIRPASDSRVGCALLVETGAAGLRGGRLRGPRAPRARRRRRHGQGRGRALRGREDELQRDAAAFGDC